VYNLSSRDPFAYLQRSYDDMRKETKDKVGVKYFTWSAWYSSMIDFVRHIHKELPKEHWDKSLLLNRLMEFYKLLLLLQELTFMGYYHSTIRELRYILESSLQSYYLDTRTKFSLNRKVERARNLYGVRNIQGVKILVGRLGMREDVKDKIISLLDLLSDLLHPSDEEMLKVYRNVLQQVTFNFNNELFNQCVTHTNKVFDVVLLLTIGEFNTLKKTIKKDDILMRWIKLSKCEFTLSSLEWERLS